MRSEAEASLLILLLGSPENRRAVAAGEGAVGEDWASRVTMYIPLTVRAHGVPVPTSSREFHSRPARRVTQGTPSGAAHQGVWLQLDFAFNDGNRGVSILLRLSVQPLCAPARPRLRPPSPERSSLVTLLLAAQKKVTSSRAAPG